MTASGRRQARSAGSPQRGMALVTALLVVALATILASQIIWTVKLQANRAASAMFFEQAFQYALGAEAWAAQILREDAEGSDEDHRGEEWAVELPPLPVEGGEVRGFLEDLQGRFNINNLVDREGKPDELAVEQFGRLLGMLEIDPRFATVLADWIDPNAEPAFPDGAEDDMYSGLTPPYRTANAAVTSISEVYALQGFDLETYLRLAPYIAALPRGTTINVNTASAPLLDALSEELSGAEAEAIVETTSEAGLGSLDELNERLGPEVAQQLSLASDYFRLVVQVSIGTSRLTMYSLLRRAGGGEVRPVLRSLATE